MITQGGSKVKVHSKAFILLLFFAIIELVDSYRSLYPDNARGLVINTLALAFISIWGSTHVLSAQTMNKILNSVKYASIVLCGIVIARHLRGGIVYEARSASMAVNGLAPVQISGYLGVSCVVFFFSIMNNIEKKNIILNLVLLCVTSVVMLLSFSRGGLYFLGGVMALYFIFNYKNPNNYFMALLLIPVGLLAYSYVTSTTNGLIEKRYEQEGSSGRNLLVEAAFTIFSDNPVAGVGTGNFNDAIVSYDLYGSESGAHNEFARVAAEHGILGIITYWGFFIALIFLIFLRRKKVQREYAIYFLLLFCLIVVHNGLKNFHSAFFIVACYCYAFCGWYKKEKCNYSTAGTQIPVKLLPAIYCAFPAHCR